MKLDAYTCFGQVKVCHPLVLGKTWGGWVAFNFVMNIIKLNHEFHRGGLFGYAQVITCPNFTWYKRKSI